jgi:hypothetical protein
LRNLVDVDKQRHPAEYKALRQLYFENRQVKQGAKGRTKVKRDANGKPQDMSNSDYYGRATYCPACRCRFEENVIPPHGSNGHGCKGAGRFGVTPYAIYLEGRAEKRSRKKKKSSTGRASTSVRTVRGGLPGLGRRR